VEHHVSYISVLKAVITPADPLLIFILFIMPILLFLVLRFSKLSAKHGKWSVLLGSGLVWGVLLLTTWGAVGSGWTLTEKELLIKAPPESAVIDLKSAKILLTDSTSEWLPVARTGGYGTPGLATGNFRLRNGQKAICFLEYDWRKLLLINFNGRYYILCHSNVEELYSQLLQQGVKKIDN
jgi:hypothetical protein